MAAHLAWRDGMQGRRRREWWQGCQRLLPQSAGFASNVSQRLPSSRALILYCFGRSLILCLSPFVSDVAHGGLNQRFLSSLIGRELQDGQSAA